MAPMKKSPLVPRMQRILHQRVTQLRILPTELVPKAAEDDNIRPRVNRYASILTHPELLCPIWIDSLPRLD